MCLALSLLLILLDVSCIQPIQQFLIIISFLMFSQDILILVRYGNFWIDATHFSSFLFYYSSLYLFCSTIFKKFFFHLLSISLSSFQFANLLLFLYPSLSQSLPFTLSLLSCIVIFGSPFILKSKTLNSLEAPCVPIRLPLCTSMAVQSGCQIFCLSVVKPPNDRPCKHFYL